MVIPKVKKRSVYFRIVRLLLPTFWNKYSRKKNAGNNMGNTESNSLIVIQFSRVKEIPVACTRSSREILLFCFRPMKFTLLVFIFSVLTPHIFVKFLFYSSLHFHQSLLLLRQHFSCYFFIFAYHHTIETNFYYVKIHNRNQLLLSIINKILFRRQKLIFIESIFVKKKTGG